MGTTFVTCTGDGDTSATSPYCGESLSDALARCWEGNDTDTRVGYMPSWYVLAFDSESGSMYVIEARERLYGMTLIEHAQAVDACMATAASA